MDYTQKVKAIFYELAGAEFMQLERAEVPEFISIVNLAWSFHFSNLAEGRDKTIALTIIYKIGNSEELHHYRQAFGERAWRVGFEGLIKTAFKELSSRLG